MRKTFAALCCSLTLILSPGLLVRAQTQTQTQTPAPEDIPQPVAGDIGLAGSACPDIARYLNVRSAISPSLSPDGSRVAYRTSTTGTPQVWVFAHKARLSDEVHYVVGHLEGDPQRLPVGS